MTEHALAGGIEAGWEDGAARWVRRAALGAGAAVMLVWGASMVVPMAARPVAVSPPVASAGPAGSPPGETQAERDRRKAAEGAGCVNYGCEAADCVDCGCEALTSTGCEAADCSACEAVDCSGLDCGAVDCGAVDCSGVDCGGCAVAPRAARSAARASERGGRRFPWGSTLALGAPLVLLTLWRRSPARRNNPQQSGVGESESAPDPGKTGDDAG